MKTIGTFEHKKQMLKYGKSRLHLLRISIVLFLSLERVFSCSSSFHHSLFVLIQGRCLCTEQTLSERTLTVCSLFEALKAFVLREMTEPLSRSFLFLILLLLFLLFLLLFLLLLFLFLFFFLFFFLYFFLFFFSFSRSCFCSCSCFCSHGLLLVLVLVLVLVLDVLLLLVLLHVLLLVVLVVLARTTKVSCHVLSCQGQP